MEMNDDIEQTLHIAREVNVYRIPPRANAAIGHRSGEWKLSDQLFTGRLRVVARGEICEVRIEDANSGDLFVVCPIPLGSRLTCIEPVSDSSRYFVVRAEDPTTRRHAFLGMGFVDRSDSFDFNEALLTHEKHVQRARATASLLGRDDNGTKTLPLGSSGSGVVGSSASLQTGQAAAAKEVESLYQHRGDLGLKEGETIRVNLKKPAKGSGLISGTHAAAVPLVPLTPLSPSGQAGGVRLAPPPEQQQQLQHSHKRFAPISPPQQAQVLPAIAIDPFTEKTPSAGGMPGFAQPGQSQSSDIHTTPFDPYSDFAVPTVTTDQASLASHPVGLSMQHEDTSWATFD